ncbi:clathrin interactor EPSIN 1, partial [Tanacetum coccineum]
TKVDLFASPPAAAASSPAVDFFAAPEQVVAPETKPAESNIHLVDPFAAVPMNNFDTSDFFAKKVDLTDVGIVGGLSAGTEEKDKGLLNSLYMGRAMGTGSGLGKSIGYSTSAT